MFVHSPVDLSGATLPRRKGKRTVRKTNRRYRPAVVAPGPCPCRPPSSPLHARSVWLSFGVEETNNPTHSRPKSGKKFVGGTILFCVLGATIPGRKYK